MIDGSALRKLEKITGLKVEKTAESCYKIEIAPSVALFSFLSDEKAAAAELREINWKRVVRNVCTAQGWRCRCGSMQPLQGHHILYRSRWRPSDGPLDVESNCECLCASCHHACHNDIHGRRDGTDNGTL